jgi:rhodanese-related sulfurtransferase
MTESARSSIEARLVSIRDRIARLSPSEALAAAQAGAVIVDTRCEDDRIREGRIPNAVVAPRSVLEWRCDPASDTADERLADFDHYLILVCNDGYSSSLAAGSLLDLGFRQAGDIIGGFRAWSVAGLPVAGS